MNLLYSLPHKIQTLFVLQKLVCILIVWFVLTDIVLLVATETVEVVALLYLYITVSNSQLLIYRVHLVL